MVVAVKALAYVGAAFSLVSASPPPPADTDQRKQVEFPMVVQVICDQGRGTAFRVGRTRFLSVDHVTSNSGCKIDGVPVVVTASSSSLDFSELEVNIPKGGAFKINCDGFKPNTWYYAVGHGYGLPTQTMVMVYASAFDNGAGGMRILIGKHFFIPGMSGGPVLNQRGEVVGTVNAYNPFFSTSFSRALRDTSICKDKLHAPL